MRYRAFFLFIPLLLTSCFDDPSRVDFEASNDPTRPSFLRNGDLILENSFTSPFSSYVRSTDAEDLSNRILREEPFYLYLTSLGCAHCLKAKDAVSSFLQQTEMEFLHLEGNAIHQELNALKELHPDLEIPKFPGTPYMFRFDGEAFSLRSVSDASSSPNQFGEHVLKDINLSLTYTFETAQGFLKHDLNAFYFTGKDDPYLVEFQNKACRYSLKEFGILNLDKLSESESSLLKESFPNAKAGTLFLQEKQFEVASNLTKAKEAFFSYLERE